MDLIRDFAHPLPTNVICDMLGIPEADRAQFIETSRISGRVIDPTLMSPQELAEANEGNRFLKDYFERLFALRRREPGDDLTTQLVQVEEAGEADSGGRPANRATASEDPEDASVSRQEPPADQAEPPANQAEGESS